MRTLARKQKQPLRQSSANFTASNSESVASDRAHQILHLERTIGNQAVLRLLQNFGQIPVPAQAPLIIQPKLAVNARGDVYEQEADRISDQVMRMPLRQHACSCDGVCPHCQAKSSHSGATQLSQPAQQDQHLQPKQLDPSSSRPPAAPRIVREVLASPGQPLDASARAFFEPRFGHDFSDVRIHVGTAAEQSARGLNAYAYTAGRNIVFGAGQFAPDTTVGRRLIAHELTHVLQQSALHSPTDVSTQNIQRWPWPVGGGQENDCSGYEKDPQSLSIETAKHFLDDVEPGGNRAVKTTDCIANAYNPNRFECDVTFEDGQVIQVTIEAKLHNVEGQRPTANGRQWCVYHFTCDANGVLQWQTKGCSYNLHPKPSAPSGPTLVG